MLYSSEAFKQAVVDTSRTWALKMDVTLSSGEVLHLTEANVNLGSTVFKDGATCKDCIQVGSTFSNSLDFALMNGEGEYSAYDFSEAKVHAYIGLVLNDETTEWVSTGLFTVVDCGKRLTTIPIYSMDDMYKANVPLSKVGIQYPININLFVQNIAAYCGISVSSNLTAELRNLQYTLQEPEGLDEKTTCRDVFGYIGVILGKNIRISRDGFLESFWYSNQGQRTTPDTRVKNSELKDGDVQVTGVIITDSMDNTYDIGTDTYVVTYDNNPFIQTSEVAQEVLQRVYSSLHGITYRAGKVYFMGDPTWQAGDIITHVLKDGTSVVFPIMSSTYSFRGVQTLQAVGDTPEQTSQLSATAKKLMNLGMKGARDLKESMTTMQRLVLQQSELITNALGFFPRVDYNTDGSVKAVYLMSTPEDTPTTLVWAITSGGIGISHTGIAGPYTSSWTSNDSIIASVVTANMVRTGLLTDFLGNNYWNLDTGEFKLSASTRVGDSSIATKQDIDDIELRPGPQGVGVASTVAYYYLSTSSTSQTGGSWSTTIPAWVDGKYYWQKFKTTYTDGTTAETTPVCITGAKGPEGAQGPRGPQGIQGEQGNTGATGTRGTGLWSVTTAPSSYTTQTGGFTPTYRMSLSTAKSQSGATNILVGDQIRYSYYTYPVGYVDSSYVYMGARVSIRGATGAKGEQGVQGEQGKGVASIEVEFYLSTDNKSCVGGSWQTTMPEWSVGKYLWTRNKITYSNPTSVAYTEPLCDSSWEAINALRIGARNFLQQSKAMVGWTRDWSSGGSVDYQQWAETNDGFVVFNALTGSPVKSRWFNSRPPLNYADTGLRGKEVTVSWDARSDEADIINATTDEGMICEIDLCTPDNVTRAKYRLKYLYAKDYPLSNDWQRYSSTFKLDDNLWSINTTSYPDYVIDENTRIFVRIYTYSPHAMQVKGVKLSEGNVPTDWTPAPEDIANDLTSEIEEVNKALVQQESDMKTTNEGFVLEALKGYVGQNEYLSFTEHVESSLKIAAEAIDMNFADSVVAKLNDSISGVSEEFNKLKSAVEKHIEFSLNGITITGSSGISLTLDNSGIVFSKGGTAFGTWDGNNFHTGNIVVDVNERAQFGNFAFVPRSDGSLSFLKVGG